jgi:hypothetical protein
MVSGAGDWPAKALSPALGFCVAIVPATECLRPPHRQVLNTQSAYRPPPCAGECPCALSVTTATVQHGQDRCACGRAVRRQDNGVWAAYYTR